MPSVVEQRTIDKQNAFINVFAEIGQEARARKLVGIRADTLRRWKDDDVNGFRELFRNAEQEFKEAKEQKWLFDRLDDPDEKTAPVLTIFALKGIWREKYGDTPELNDDQVRQTITALASVAQKQEQEQTQVQTVDYEREFLASLAPKEEQDARVPSDSDD